MNEKEDRLFRYRLVFAVILYGLPTLVLCGSIAGITIGTINKLNELNWKWTDPVESGLACGKAKGPFVASGEFSTNDWKEFAGGKIIKVDGDYFWEDLEHYKKTNEYKRILLKHGGKYTNEGEKFLVDFQAMRTDDPLNIKWSAKCK